MQFPQDLTEDEAGQGFQLQEIDDPEGRAGGPRKARAVVYQSTDPAARVVKVREPGTGRVEYHRQVHGIGNPPRQGEVPHWVPCGRHADPATAISPEARDSDLARLNPPIVPSPPAVASRQHGATG